MEKELPKELLAAEPGYVKKGVAHFEYLGEYEGKEAWLLVLHTDVGTGYPTIYFWDNGEVSISGSEEALDVIRLLRSE